MEVDQTILIQFAQKLAGNEKKFRDRALKKLRRWLETRSQSDNGAFTEEDFIKVWKGLHYCMWMADTPLVQEELASNLAELVHCLARVEQAFLFIEVFFQTESREWFGIDRLRLDKFMMLIRRMLAESLHLLSRHGWKVKHLKRLAAILGKGVASPNSDTPDGLKIHVADIYMEELEKAGADQLQHRQIQLLLEPFMQLILHTRNRPLMRHVLKQVFVHMVDYGVEKILDKQRAAGVMEESEDEEDEAGKPKFYVMNVDFEKLADRLFQLASSEQCLGRNRKDIYNIVKTYRDLAAGILPQEETFDLEDEEEGSGINVAEAAQRLSQFESKLMRQTGKKRKKKQKKPDQSKGEPPVKKQKTEAGDAKSTSDSNDDKKSKNKFRNEETKKKKGKGKVEEKREKEREKKKVQEMSTFFSGGFVDSDDDLPQSDGSFEGRIPEEVVAGLADLGSDMSEVWVQPEVGTAQADKKSYIGTLTNDTKKGKHKSAMKMEDSLTVTSEHDGCETTEPDASSSPQGSKKAKRKSLEKDAEQTTSNVLMESGTPQVTESETATKTKKLKRKSLGDEIVTNKVETKRRKSLGDMKISSAKTKRKSVDNVEITVDNILKAVASAVDVNSKSVAVTGCENGNVKQKVLKSNEVKKKRKSFGDVEEQFMVTKEREKSVKVNKKDLRRKSMGGLAEQSAEHGDEGEVEIWVPNRKYDGKLKGWFADQAKKSLEDSPKKKKTPEKGLISFEKVKTPPAFVRRALDKVSPKTESRKKVCKAGAANTPDSSRKRVSFIMSMNQAQEYRESLNLSPMPAFNPDNKPNCPIIKPLPAATNTPPLSCKMNLKKQTLLNTRLNTPSPKAIYKKALAKGRASAADFF